MLVCRYVWRGLPTRERKPLVTVSALFAPTHCLLADVRCSNQGADIRANCSLSAMSRSSANLLPVARWTAPRMGKLGDPPRVSPVDFG